MPDQEPIVLLLRENHRLKLLVNRWRTQAYRQKARAEMWRHRALRKTR